MILVHHLLWDEWNLAHIARHKVSQVEVEEICHGSPLTLEAKKGRIILIGPTKAARMVAAVLAPQGAGIYYPITARPASKKERGLYLQQKGE